MCIRDSHGAVPNKHVRAVKSKQKVLEDMNNITVNSIVEQTSCVDSRIVEQ